VRSVSGARERSSRARDPRATLSLNVGALLVGPGQAEEQARAPTGWGLPHQSMSSPPGACAARSWWVPTAPRRPARRGVLGKELVGPEHAALVDPEACIGCLKCARVCPFDAVGTEPVRFDLGRYSYDGRIATIDPLLCTGCGACAAACMNLAADLPGYTSAELEAQLASALLRTKTVGLVCNWSAYRAYDEAARARRCPRDWCSSGCRACPACPPRSSRSPSSAGPTPCCWWAAARTDATTREARGSRREPAHSQGALQAQGDLDRVKAIWLARRTWSCS